MVIPLTKPLRGRAFSKPVAASIFPAGVVLVVVVLGSLGVSGSSIGLYATQNGIEEEQAGVLVGPPRPIRSDEWLVRTPWVLRQVERGLSERAVGGVGTHDPALTYELPITGWEVLLRPQTAPYRFLPAEQAFAVEWWALFAVQVLGVYALLLVLTGRVALSALAASLVALSPATQWWTVTQAFTTIGYGAFATALVLLAHRARTNRGRAGLSVLAGLALAAFLSTLYPPWQLGTALVLVPVAVAWLVPDLWRAESRRPALRSLAVVLPVAVGVGGLLFAGFVLSHRDAVEALSETVYPGSRNAEAAGTAGVQKVLSAPFDSFASAKQLALVNGTNQSENSSALPLLLPVAVAALVLLTRGRLRGSRSAPALLGCLVGGSVLAAWMLLPVPADLGRLLLLTRVPPSRLLVPFGLAGVIAVALLASHQEESGHRLGPWGVLAAVAALAAALAWEAANYTVDGEPVDMAVAAALAAVVVVGVALSLSRRPVAGLAVLAAFTLWQATLINPLQDGLGPLTETPLRASIDAAAADAPRDAGWIAFGVDATVRGTLTAAGVNNFAGVRPYPDTAAWRLLDPDLANEDLWNRYAHVSFAVGEPGSAPSFELLSSDSVVVTVDPCSPVVRRLGARFAVTQGFELGTCVRPVARVPWGESYVAVYEYS